MEFRLTIDVDKGNTLTYQDVLKVIERSIFKFGYRGHGIVHALKPGTTAPILDLKDSEIEIGKWELVLLPGEQVFNCRACGREENACSADPCREVILDRLA